MADLSLNPCGIPLPNPFNPAPTTVDRFLDKMGYAATEMLASLIQVNSLDSSLYWFCSRLEIKVGLSSRDQYRRVPSFLPPEVPVL